MGGLERNLSRADERCYGHYGSMEEALARSIVTSKQHVAAVLEVVKDWRPRRVLDIGAGAGAMLRLLSEKGFAQEYAATDLSQLSVSFLNNHPFPGFVGATKAGADNLPYEDQSFDLAILSHVLEHVPDPVLTLEEAARVAARVCFEVPLELAFLPTAKAALITMIWGRIRSINRIGHLHFYCVRCVRDLVRSAGLQMEAHFRYRIGIEWLNMHFGTGSLNVRIRETFGSVLPINLYGFFFTTHFTALCSKASSRS